MFGWRWPSQYRQQSSNTHANATCVHIRYLYYYQHQGGCKSLEAVPAKTRPVKSIDGDHHVQSHKHSVHLGHCFASGLSYFLHDLQQRLGSWQYLPEES